MLSVVRTLLQDCSCILATDNTVHQERVSERALKQDSMLMFFSSGNYFICVVVYTNEYDHLGAFSSTERVRVPAKATVDME